ncbi:MAG: 4-hydroxy-tetrahydrodipicolinate synthase [Hydrotalea flava]|uniref:4-hydroxy-tetrahydrodipicolinate synthase n=1 Tax=Hydrotalea TaxID=1004300 RepID=UPI001C467F83|nr:MULTISPECIES: 4-hydroxy-tetrahydrodipicolinate synthase [Hydrotalea]MBY0349135.1 4-hydroxy-tetrahydrodipicolinate synthase [Hydrotalea flava]
MNSLHQILKGTGVAIITPFTAQKAVDYPALGRVIEHIISGGAEYIVTLGTTGETPTLTKDEKIEIVHFTFEKVNNRIPVVVGIGGNNTQSVIDDVQSYPLEKAAAILSAAPYYNKPSQQGIYEHYKAIAQSAPKPVILYNVPGRTGRNITAATTLRLAHEVPNIAGMKEASGDFQQCMDILRDRPSDFLVVSGDDAISLPLIALGMDGVISVAANAFPKEFSTMIRYCLDGNFNLAKPLHFKLLQAFDYMFVENNPAGVKAFMHHLTLIENSVRLPVVPVSTELDQKIQKWLQQFQ